jgi:DNA-binding NarL/FixJ family response regulator
VTVLLVDDHPTTRDGVRSSLERRAGITIAGEAGDPEAALACAADVLPDVVLLDLRLGGRSIKGGLDLLRALLALLPGTRVLVFSQSGAEEAVTALRAGAHGFVAKSATGAELAAAVLAVRSGPVLPPALAARVFGEFQRPARRDQLTPREREVLGCLARGYDNRDISDALGISIRTVNRHLENIRGKVGQHRRSDLFQLASDGADG